MVNAFSPRARFLGAVLAAAVALRLALVIYAHAGGHFAFGDGRFYVELGRSLAAGRGLSISPAIFEIDPGRGAWTVALMERWRVTGLWDFILPGRPTAFVMPLYPLFVGGVFFLCGSNILVLRLVQVVVAAAVPLLLYDVGLRLFGRRAALWGAAAGAVYPFFIFYAASVTNQLFSLVAWLAVIDCYLWARERRTAGSHALLGVIGGVAFLIRSEMLVPVVAAAGATILVERRRPARAVALAALTTAAALGVATPWAWRNHVVMGKYSYFATQAPRVLWEADLHPFSREFERGEVLAYARLYEGVRARHLPSLERRELVEMPIFHEEGEFERADILKRRVLGFLAANPGAYLDLCAIRARQILRFTPLNFGGLPYFISFAGYAVIVLVGAAGLVAARRYRPVFLYSLFAYSLLLLVAVVYGTAYRVALLDPLLIIFGGAAFQRWGPGQRARGAGGGRI